tara:strand:+ start:307 stop:504 length:198 start_codon:yes stop_codon:yes gene_type:complete
MNKKLKKIDTLKTRSEINKLRISLVNFRFQKSTGQLEKTAQIRKIRKKIAFLLTNINQQKENKSA